MQVYPRVRSGSDTRRAHSALTARIPASTWQLAVFDLRGAHKNVVAQIRKATRKQYSAEEKIRIVLEGLWGEIPT